MASISIIFGGTEEAVHELDQPKMVVGREPDNEIQIDNLGVSRHHCAFEKRGDTYIVKDMGSSNGTYCNGKKITEHFLNNGDEVIIGKYTLKFKNEEQSTETSSPDNDAVPDTMNTYVMDGDKVREQVAKLRAAQQAGTGGAAPATAKEYAQAVDGPDQQSLNFQLESIKKLLTVSLIANVLLIIAVLILALRGG